MMDKADHGNRSYRGTIADQSAGSWRTQRWILVTYLVLTSVVLITWGQGFTIIAFVAAAVAWAGQWGVTVLLLTFLRTRIGRFFRNSYLVAAALIGVIISMAVLTWMEFGLDAHINGWVVLWRVVATLWISSFSVRLALLGQKLTREKSVQESLKELRIENLDALRSQRLDVVDRVGGLMTSALERSLSSIHGKPPRRSPS
jgi:hypothetical protein